jgi:hypothetical protein
MHSPAGIAVFEATNSMKVMLIHNLSKRNPDLLALHITSAAFMNETGPKPWSTIAGTHPFSPLL